ncbi:MAG: type IV pilus assembly protein PilM [Candidatus Omnitrophota bacterium]|nr:type IV pilus assembly protein PilM [Candidatus Omnitrophota bacterium]
MEDILKKYFSQYFLKIKELIPKSKPKTFVGLDIGASSVKVVEINNDAVGFTIDKFTVEAVNQDDVASSIANALEKSGVATKTVNTSVSGQGVIIRYVVMPKMPLSDIKSSISLEADKYFPFPLEEVIMDCFILEDSPLENKVFVLIAAAKKELIEQRIALLLKLNLEPQIISTDSIAMANVFNVLGPKLNIDYALDSQGRVSSLAVLNIGATFSNLNIIKNNLPCFTRDIFIGGIDFTKKISNILGLDMKAAENLKLNGPDDEKQKILDACESVLNNLLTEIRLSFDYFETENNIPVSHLYLSGGGSYLKGLDETMRQGLGIEIDLWQPFLGLNVNPNLSTRDLKAQANKLSIAIGLALR